jgi:Fe-S-cluster containining protein
MSLDEFKKVHTRLVDGRYSLNEKSNYDCVFLKEKKCTIYEVRPVQCQTFPWWPGNLQSKERWNSAAASCEGITPSAPKVNFNDIQDGLRR